MIRKLSLALGAILFVLAAPAFAEGIEISNAYARSNSPVAKAGGAFMDVTNTGQSADRLLSVSSDRARTVQIHENNFADGVASMRELTGGITIRPGTTIRLMRGGDHIMMMGLSAPLKDGETVPLTLTFETAGEVMVDVPVDLSRSGNDTMIHNGSGMMQGAGHKHGDGHMQGNCNQHQAGENAQMQGDCMKNKPSGG